MKGVTAITAIMETDAANAEYLYETFRVYDVKVWVHPTFSEDPLEELQEALTQVWKTDPYSINWKPVKYQKQPPSAAGK